MSSPPGPRGLPYLGVLVRQRHVLEFLSKTARDYGDISQIRMGARDVVLLNHPDLIRDVLVTQQHSFHKGRGLEWAKVWLGEGLLTSEAPLHTRQRRLAQPAFHRQRIGSYGTVMTQAATRCRDRWIDGGTVDLSREMMALTLDIAGQTLFGASLHTEAPRVAEAMATIMAQFPRFRLPYGRLLQKLPLASNARFDAALRFLDEFVAKIVHERRKSAEDRGDLLSMMLEARDVEGDGSGMSDQQLRDEIMTMLLAGHETTANALIWTWYLLSQNPEAEAAFHQEIDRVLDGGRPPTFEDLPALTYTEQVLAESIRLYPPAWGFGRRTINPVKLGGYTLPSGRYLITIPYVTHRDPRWFPDPERFDPARFTPEARAARPKFAYFPFGGGARSCIGESFAWMEGVLVLATLGQRWRMELVPGHPVVPEPLITLRSKHGMPMRLVKRQ